MSEQAHPRVCPVYGSIRRVGTGTPELVRFAEDPAAPGTFYAVHPDGTAVTLGILDVLSVDVIGPGQSVRVGVLPESVVPPRVEEP